MLVLTFQIAGDRLALDIRRVREVVPRVALQRVAGSPGWLAGLFVYRGQVVPVLDLHRLLEAGECPPHLSSRIILVPMPSPDPEHAPLVGLLAAQVAEIRELPNKRATRQSIVGPGKVNLGTPLVDTDGILHLLDLDRLLPDTVRALLSDLPSGEA